MEPPHRILFIDDEKKLCKNVQTLLRREGMAVDVAVDGSSGMQRLNASVYDLVITDVVMPDVSGMDIVRYVRDFMPDTPVIVITGFATLEGAVVAMREGAYDYVTKPIDFDFLKLSVARALERTRLKRTIKRYTEELEERVRDRTRELEEAQAQLIQSEKMAAIGELAARVAHEIKNPLMSIGGLARLLQRKANKVQRTREIAAIIREEADRLERILENLLELRQDQPLRKRHLSLHRILRGTLKLVSSQMEQQRVQVHWDLGQNVPRIFTDEDRLKQVLLNLCNNAIQAMPQGGQLRIRTERHAEEVHVIVSDTGPGISPVQQRNLFTPFYTTKKHGTGLGLAISRKLMRDLGGEISLEDPAGGGTAFRVRLPLRPPPPLESTVPEAGDNPRPM